MGRRLIPFEALKDKGFPYSKVHIWRLEREGKFPRRVKPGTGDGGRNSSAWVEDEIDDHIEKLINQRDEKLIDEHVGKLIKQRDSDDGRKTAKPSPASSKSRITTGRKRAA